MYHKFGEVVTQPVVDFSTAYLDHGREPFRDAAVRHALHAASLPVDSDARREDFNPLGHHVRARGGLRHGLRPHDPGGAGRGAPKPSASGANTSTATTSRISRPTRWTTTSGSTPSPQLLLLGHRHAGRPSRAKKWFRYCYEVWCARFPILDGDDGGWRRQQLRQGRSRDVHLRAVRPRA